MKSGLKSPYSSKQGTRDYILLISKMMSSHKNIITANNSCLSRLQQYGGGLKKTSHLSASKNNTKKPFPEGTYPENYWHPENLFWGKSGQWLETRRWPMSSNIIFISKTRVIFYSGNMLPFLLRLYEFSLPTSNMLHFWPLSLSRARVRGRGQASKSESVKRPPGCFLLLPTCWWLLLLLSLINAVMGMAALVGVSKRNPLSSVS
jgi:hypothetical protein